MMHHRYIENNMHMYIYIYTPIYGQGLPHTRGQTNMDVDNPWFPFREIIYNI
jgi:hypothetical protein